MTQDRAAVIASELAEQLYYAEDFSGAYNSCLKAISAAREEGYEQGLHAARQSVLTLNNAIADRARAVAIEECALKIEGWSGLTFAKLLASELRELTAEEEADT